MSHQRPAHEHAFVERHVGTSAEQQRAMLDVVGHDTLADLVRAAVPASVLSPGEEDEGLREPGLAEPASEAEVLAELRALAARNRLTTPLVGLGYYGTHTPSVIQRTVLENPSWYTAYTPYQPEISQGRLEALLVFQTMVEDLTGLDIANSSMLDESTAAVEAMLLARRAARSKSRTFLVDDDVLPQTRRLLDHRAEAVGIELVYADLAGLAAADGAPVTLPPTADGEGFFGVLVQYPGASGRVWDPSPVLAAARSTGGIAVVAADLLATTILRPPGELGADVAVGTTQRFGVPMGFGGPHAGYLAVRAGLERQLPGRLVGVSRDADGAPAYRLALQTREQHIRREKATSNICTAQVLLAVMAAMYAVYHGPEGLRAIALRVHARAATFAGLARERGMAIAHDAFFDTVRVTGIDAPGAWAALRAHGFTAWVAGDDALQVAFDETTGPDVPFHLAAVLAAHAAGEEAEGFGWTDHGRAADGHPADLPASLARESDYLTHPTFHAHRSETAMMRYLKRLADADYALDRGMIPLGSCTMKLNAATEMAAVTWPEISRLHPFAPREDAAGTLSIVADLERWLAALTGYDAVSLQPNAGSQGELAGLLAIREYHRSRGEHGRVVCLIPSSAHGTNAASAVLAGMRVVVVACDEAGNVDVGDLRAKVAEHADALAALMITYPSTHGVYEASVREIADAVHDAGGQVYIDGANLNALVGWGRFGEIGGDVSHLNLHKTFCIPHGGGGPGVGPVAAKAHLAPFLPGFGPRDRDPLANPVAAAPYGSASILPITWAYLRLMGADGLRDATAAAVLAANYVAARLREAYPVLYTGSGGLVAHECILDLRQLKAATGVSVDDVAKRLVDYGFHAPTMSFPVPGTLMVEPTESEDLAELDRFVEAMLAIHDEAARVGAGEWPREDNPLVGAPHTAASVVATEWTHPYSRETAAYPVASLRGTSRKYWPPVRRIDQAFGDRNLVCSCPPPEAFA
ncbi:MAG: glycine dehydrogenase (aminomethyl-transferring) [Micrococcales bacterium 73-15]|uniref:aminomethyl-transferring glycine dehydrogenase n=1 Tax=Salana multivorans TaxID=120377 RepID=UPI000969F3CE|nr:aminomethyl-transferring glycine dehydrogenase [Salana multivorans]OJX97308.1 MAG: glycine dehydrogenase (aminomethyl-transferring) [Micrococcales bacterium 73-15]